MIVSTTLTGNQSPVIADALRSVVKQVDACLVIDTGVTDDTLYQAAQVAGDKLRVRMFRWADDFSAARNFALDAATLLGAHWAVTVDTDERLVFQPGLDLQEKLANAKAGVLLVGSLDGYYVKERCIRLPTTARWSGPTHEALLGPPSEILAGVHFTELPKDGAALTRKFERDVRILTAYTAEHPTDPRWWYYLGTSHHDLGQYEQAIHAFRSCAELRGWDEEGAWACFRAAQCYVALGRFREAVEMCAQGLAIRPATAELAWLAGHACLQDNKPERAIAWAHMAVANGLYSAVGYYPHLRIGFRDVAALYEAPYEVLRQAYEQLGWSSLAEASAVKSRMARTAREARQ